MYRVQAVGSICGHWVSFCFFCPQNSIPQRNGKHGFSRCHDASLSCLFSRASNVMSFPQRLRQLSSVSVESSLTDVLWWVDQNFIPVWFWSALYPIQVTVSIHFLYRVMNYKLFWRALFWLHLRPHPRYTAFKKFVLICMGHWTLQFGVPFLEVHSYALVQSWESSYCVMYRAS